MPTSFLSLSQVSARYFNLPHPPYPSTTDLSLPFLKKQCLATCLEVEVHIHTWNITLHHWHVMFRTWRLWPGSYWETILTVILHFALHATNLEGRSERIQDREVSWIHLNIHQQSHLSIPCKTWSLCGSPPPLFGARFEESICLCQWLSRESAYSWGKNV